MKFTYKLGILFILASLFLSNALYSQSFSFNCTRDTLVPNCPANFCFTLKGTIPDVRQQTGTYTLNPTSTVTGCFPTYVAPNDPQGTPTNLTVDDTYSSLITMGFPFSFYGNLYTTLVASTNGYLSFDASEAGGFAGWSINADLPSANYDRAVIMGPNHDLYPTTTQPSQRIQYQVYGTAPHRRWVLSFNQVRLFSCTSLTENTHQIVLYESLNIIEVLVYSKQTCPTWNSGRAIIGIQDWNKTSGMMAPGRTAMGPTWGALNMNESWRFVPNSGNSLLKRVELLDNTGAIVGTLSPTQTTNLGNGKLEVSFPNICPPAGATTQYIIRSVYEKFDDPNVEIVGTDTVRVNRSAGLAATATPNAASCGNTNGSITVSAPSGGTPPYQYSIDGGATWQSSNVFNGLGVGTYTITVKDTPGLCTIQLPVNIVSAGNLAATVSSVATACTGLSNGSITISSAAGAGPHSFSIDGGPPVQGSLPFTFTNVSAGNHTVVVTDLPTNCNSGSLTVNVAVGPGVTVTTSPVATSCSGATNGTLTVSPTSGTAPFQFSIDGGAFVTRTAPYTFTALAAGTHTVVVRDALGCTSTTISTLIGAGPVLTSTATTTAVLCNGGNTGTITVVQPTVGAVPFEYSINGTTWQTSTVFNGLTAGAYTVRFRESAGCVGSTSVTVTEPTAIALSATTVPVICNAQANGTINITASGGVAPYQFSIDGGATWQAATSFNVRAGSYTVTIKDANNCTRTTPITVTEPAVLTAAVLTTNATCNGGNDGSITLTPSGGNGTYNFSIDNGTTWQPTNSFNLAPGSYAVIVKDALNCTTTVNAVVGLTNDLRFTPQNDVTICESKSTQLNLVSNGLQYDWTPATGLSAVNIPNPIASPLSTSTYIVKVTLGRCSALDTVVVNVNPAPVPNAGPDLFICYGQTATLQGSGGTVYRWSPSTYLNNSAIPNAISTPDSDITYVLSILSDANGCAGLVTDSMHIDVTPPLQVLTFPADTIGYPGDQFQLLAVPSDPDATNFTWTPSVGLSNALIGNPMVTIGAIGSDVRYKVVASTLAGCKGEAYVNVRVYKGPDIYVPSGFTPNGDGKNDKFTPFPVGMKSYNYFRVFNRWGQAVFQTKKLNDGWDGTLGGQLQPEGIYVWMIEGLTKDDRIITKKGTIMLIK